MLGRDITPIGITNFRNTNKLFGIKDKDRLGHVYVIGKTGVGKSTLLKSMALSDIKRGNGLAVIDPHGDVAQDLLRQIPEERRRDLIHFNPKDEEPIGFNPLYNIPHKYHHLVASGLISAFKNIWKDSWGPRLEYILRNCILSLLCYPEATLLDIQQLLTDAEFRKRVLLFVEDKHLLLYWQNEFEQYSKSYRTEAIGAILNKTGIFLSSMPMRNIIGQNKSDFKIGAVLNESKILIVDVAKGSIGESASALLGSFVVNAIQLAAMHRANQDEHKRKPFYLYIDECHCFIGDAFVSILAECRKFGLSLFLAHQYVRQLEDPIRDAIFGNVGTMICFRVGADSAESLIKEFHPPCTVNDLISLPRHSMYIKLLIDGATSVPFSATTIFR